MFRKVKDCWNTNISFPEKEKKYQFSIIIEQKMSKTFWISQGYDVEVDNAKSDQFVNIPMHLPTFEPDIIQNIVMVSV